MHRSIITNQIAIKSHSCMLYVVKLSVSNRYPLMIFHKSIVPAKLGVCHDRHSCTSKPDTFNVLWKNYCFFFPLLALSKSINKLYNSNLPFMHYKTWFPQTAFSTDTTSCKAYQCFSFVTGGAVSTEGWRTWQNHRPARPAEEVLWRAA